MSLSLAAALHDLAIFLLAVSAAGVGYSLLFRSALEVINAAVPAHHRGGVLSALYLLAYLSLAAVALDTAALAGLVVGTVVALNGPIRFTVGGVVLFSARQAWRGGRWHPRYRPRSSPLPPGRP